MENSQKPTSNEDGLSMISAIVGLGLIISAYYFFNQSQLQFKKTVKTSDKKVDDKRLVVSKALALQALSFDILLAIAEEGELECKEKKSTDQNIPAFSLTHYWLELNANQQYCLTIPRYKLQNKNRLLDIELKLTLRSKQNSEKLSHSTTYFRKSR
jgi:hypothetical protein